MGVPLRVGLLRGSVLRTRSAALRIPHANADFNRSNSYVKLAGRILYILNLVRDVKLYLHLG